jgi:phosphoribosylaminoimidazole-succinocarboxamide synthase
MSRAALRHHYTGKVRDLYEVDHDRMLIVASDRISVFDVVLPDEIPDKGRVLTGLSTFWFEQTAHLWPNHVVSSDPTDLPETAGPEIAGRAMLVRATRPVRLECIARGYLFGSAWNEYAERGTVCGRTLPAGLQQAERLPEPIFTSTTKAESGHDETVTDAEAAALVGDDVFEQIRTATLRIYEFAAAHAAQQGVILADTKLEFGTIDDQLLVIDEMLTPDSSRYWPSEHYTVGGSPPSFDKQFVRDHYLSLGWDQKPPAPPLPAHVIDGTRARYVEAYELITGESFDEWFAPED